MNSSSLLILLFILLVGAYFLGRKRARQWRAQGQATVALPSHYGALIAMWTGLPALLLMLGWYFFADAITANLLIPFLPAATQQAGGVEVQLALQKVYNLANNPQMIRDDSLDSAVAHLLALEQRVNFLTVSSVLAIALAGLGLTWLRLRPSLHARLEVERIARILLWLSSAVALLTTFGILASVLYESWLFFSKVSAVEFLFGTHWSPQISLRADQSGSSGSFGAVPLFAGTLLITLIAMLVSVPIGLMSAIYLVEYAHPTVRRHVKPALEILAGIPTVVYGFFAALTVAPWVRDMGAHFGLSVSSESALAAGLVMGIMIIPFISSLSDDVINAVPQAMRDGSYGLGATKSETVKKVVLPAALPGIVGAIMLAVSRAIGETMIVAMAAGLAANLTANPFESVTTVTVQIVTLLVGDQEFNSAKTLAAFALGLVLFLVTLVLNFLALKVVKKYREQYE